MNKFSRRLILTILHSMVLLIVIIGSVLALNYVCWRDSAITLDDPDISVRDVYVQEICITGKRSGWITAEYAVLYTDGGTYYYSVFDDLDEATQKKFFEFEKEQISIAVLNRHSLLSFWNSNRYFNGMQQVVAVQSDSEDIFPLRFYNRSARGALLAGITGITVLFLIFVPAIGFIVIGDFISLKDEYRKKQNKLRKKQKKRKKTD